MRTLYLKLKKTMYMLMVKADQCNEVNSTSKPPTISANKKHLQKSLLPTHLARSRVPACPGLDAQHPPLLSLSHPGLCRPRQPHGYC